MLKYILLASAVFLASFGSNAQSLQGEFKDWAVFTANEKGSKVCYMTSNPVHKSGNYRVRGDVYMLVTYRKPTTPEVSIDTGYSYKRGSEVSLTVNGRQTFKFFTSPQTPQMAWAKNEKMDKDVVAVLKYGSKLAVKGTSDRGTYSVDTYSLRGFTSAYNKMMALCQ